MKFLAVLAVLLASSSPALAAVTASQKKDLTLREITEPELEALAKKLIAELAQCAHKSPDDQVVASVTNSTDEYIDKTKLADWLREGLKPKKSLPEIAPFYEVRAKLSSQKSEKNEKKKRVYRAVYTLQADVYQDDKKICEKAQTLEKSGTWE